MRWSTRGYNVSIFYAPYRSLNGVRVPCGDCQDRKPACNGKCSKYAEFTAKNNAARQAMQRAKENDDYMVKSTARSAHKKLRQI